MDNTMSQIIDTFHGNSRAQQILLLMFDKYKHMPDVSPCRNVSDGGGIYVTRFITALAVHNVSFSDEVVILEKYLDDHPDEDVTQSFSAKIAIYKNTNNIRLSLCDGHNATEELYLSILKKHGIRFEDEIESVKEFFNMKVKQRNEKIRNCAHNNAWVDSKRKVNHCNVCDHTWDCSGCAEILNAASDDPFERVEYVLATCRECGMKVGLEKIDN
jgi:PIN domain nuclease of toxin-antitoxin system